MSNIRVCAACGKEQAIDNFSVDRSENDGRSRVCKKCNKESCKKYVQSNYKKNKEKLNNGTLDEPTKVKKCRICKKNKATISSLWPRDFSRRDGFNTACKVCVAIKQQRPNEVLAKMKQNAKKRGLEFHLSIEDLNKYWGKPCYYCNQKTIGWLDRIDSSKGYELSNVVPCCGICNTMKLDLPEDKFYSHMKLILENIKQRNK
ncbi:MAG: hypothetical protein COU29_00180 [Candidatus Magasanikbacteria bacterium CG10_big_fil_rev_8_21_14_0_10_36_32]|uniref:Uncharacterized protein n=1 Tax=Candidatus Magasanikbacteria bacterium CG10_big_fil_rev_8_21_14_0_10_36_32 TaxID=1974646 RepID=A0A2M6W7M2_9BACT|nr:MAG: hypothetical protein COU29_00180 [Candidatus Magasanikbacteria bacterium CG10_big_fil_rev_8_21_14_0_10_36_32]